MSERYECLTKFDPIVIIDCKAAHRFLSLQVITSQEAEERGQKYDAEGRTYLFDLDYEDGDCLFTVDAAYLGNISHFMNHSVSMFDIRII